MGSFSWLKDIECVLLDWGGTLCRSDRERDAILRGIVGITTLLGLEDEAARASISASLGKVMQQAYQKADTDPEHREIDVPRALQAWGEQMGFARRRQWDLPRMLDELWNQWVGCLEPLGKPVPVLEELRRRGYRLALLSNVAAPPAVCRAELRRLGLEPLLECCTFSSEIGRRKPHPAIFQKVLEVLGDGTPVEPKTIVYVGDSPRWDVGGAKAAGMRAVLFRGRTGDWPESDYQTYKPDAVVDRLDELLVLFRGRGLGARST
jgi:HAD superfamily hydrolase (TIGR01549 family)